MPTISHLPPGEAVSAADLVPVSQDGAVVAISVGSLLAQTQPAIIVSPPSLLGRTSLGPGGPDQIAIGAGLALNDGTLQATGGGAGVTSVGFSGLSPLTALSANDLVAVCHAGQDHTVSYQTLLNGVTIDQANAAAAANDSDLFWTGQAGGEMARQTLSALWDWIGRKLPVWRPPAIVVAVDLVLDGAAHNGAVVACSLPLSIGLAQAGLGTGFHCEVINLTNGLVIFPVEVTASNRARALVPGQACSVRTIALSGGSVLHASVCAGDPSEALPGFITNLSATSVIAGSLALSWSAPVTGGTPEAYLVQYRVTGTVPWTFAKQCAGTTQTSVTGLQGATSYDFTVSGANRAGVGSASTVLTAATSAGGGLPGAPTGVTITNIGSTTLTCSWAPPSAGGAGLTYLVYFRVTGQSGWTLSVSGLTATNYIIVSLTANTSYDIQVTAANGSGTGPASGIVSATTSGAAGSISSIVWNIAPSGVFTHGSGAIGVNAHVTPANAPVRFGFSTSSVSPPASWTDATYVNTDLWGAYVATPATAGTWYGWAEGTDGSSPTVASASFTVV